MSADRSAATTESRDQRTYSELHRENAIKSLALRDKIEALADTDLMRLMEEHDRLWLDAECGKEIRSEWAAQGRKLVDALTPDAKHGCTCDICAITHGLNAATETLRAHPPGLRVGLEARAVENCKWIEANPDDADCPTEWPDSPEEWCPPCFARSLLVGADDA